MVAVVVGQPVMAVPVVVCLAMTGTAALVHVVEAGAEAQQQLELVLVHTYVAIVASGIMEVLAMCLVLIMS